MLRCAECGWTGTFEELRPVEEFRGEFWGMPAYEMMYYCPACGSDEVDDYIPGQEDEEDGMA